jgi:hypothetical protein
MQVRYWSLGLEDLDLWLLVYLTYTENTDSVTIAINPIMHQIMYWRLTIVYNVC